MDEKKSAITHLPAILAASGGLITAIIGLMTFMSTPAPTVTSFDASPSIIGMGESSMLKWSVTGNGATVIIDPDIGMVALSGSREVSPANTTNYVLTATNKDKVTTATVQLVVEERAPESDNATVSEGSSDQETDQETDQEILPEERSSEADAVKVRSSSSDLSDAPSEHDGARPARSDIAEVSSGSASSGSSGSEPIESDLTEVSSSAASDFASSRSAESDLSEVSSPPPSGSDSSRPAESDLTEVSSPSDPASTAPVESDLTEISSPSDSASSRSVESDLTEVSAPDGSQSEAAATSSEGGPSESDLTEVLSSSASTAGLTSTPASVSMAENSTEGPGPKSEPVGDVA